METRESFPQNVLCSSLDKLTREEKLGNIKTTALACLESDEFSGSVTAVERKIFSLREFHSKFPKPF